MEEIQLSPNNHNITIKEIVCAHNTLTLCHIHTAQAMLTVV